MARASPRVARAPGHAGERHQGSPSNLWAIVLAGGEGVRLRPLVRRLYGEDRPKQYAALLGPRSLLRQTLDRVRMAVPTARTAVVTLAQHARWATAEFRGERTPHVLAQPADRGTAAGILYPAHWIHARDPDSTVVVLPSDHLVVEEARFMRHVVDVAEFAERHPGWIVLLGAQPTEAETEYGWFETGERMGWTACGPIYRIRRFHEKPSASLARLLLTVGCLWNTFVFAARTSTLIEVGRGTLPRVHEPLARAFAVPRAAPDEAETLRDAFAAVPAESFSYGVLERCPGGLAVSKVPGVSWCDLGSPRRVAMTLAGLGMSPPWLDGCGFEALGSAAGA